MTDSMRLVLVEWVDSVGAWRDWGRLRYDDPTLLVIRSVGWLLVDGENYKVIVPHFSPKSVFFGSHEDGCGDMAIPSVAVRRMVDLVEAEAAA